MYIPLIETKKLATIYDFLGCSDCAFAEQKDQDYTCLDEYGPEPGLYGCAHFINKNVKKELTNNRF